MGIDYLRFADRQLQLEVERVERCLDSMTVPEATEARVALAALQSA
jgi:hypothetical protein